MKNKFKDYGEEYPVTIREKIETIILSITLGIAFTGLALLVMLAMAECATK